MNSTTLAVGDTAPGFSLSAANRKTTLSLESLLAHGAAVIEFLRGTW